MTYVPRLCIQQAQYYGAYWDAIMRWVGSPAPVLAYLTVNGDYLDVVNDAAGREDEYCAGIEAWQTLVPQLVAALTKRHGGSLVQLEPKERTWWERALRLWSSRPDNETEWTVERVHAVPPEMVASLAEWGWHHVVWTSMTDGTVGVRMTDAEVLARAMTGEIRWLVAHGYEGAYVLIWVQDSIQAFAAWLRTNLTIAVVVSDTALDPHLYGRFRIVSRRSQNRLVPLRAQASQADGEGCMVPGMRLLLQTEDASAQTILTFGLEDVRDSQNRPAWENLAACLLEEYLSQNDLVIMIEAFPQYDWYSDYCADHGVEMLVKPGTGGPIRVYARPDKHQRSFFLRELIDDEVWDKTDMLTLSVISLGDVAALDALTEQAATRICPIDDGTGIEWTGPAQDAPEVTALIQRLAAEAGAVLVTKPKG